MDAFIWKLTHDKDLEIGQTVGVRSINGKHDIGEEIPLKVSNIDSIDTDSVLLYSIDGCQYTASEIILISL